MKASVPDLNRTLAGDDLLGAAIRAVDPPRGGPFYLCGQGVPDALHALSGNLLVCCAERSEAQRLARALAGSRGGIPVEHRTRPGVFTVRSASSGGRALTVSSFPPGGIAEKLDGAGLTAMAMAVDLAEGPPWKIIDPHGGVADLERGLLGAVSPASAARDPGRLLPAVALCTRYGILPTPETELALRRAAPRLPGMEPARTWRAMSMLMGGPGIASGAEMMRRLGFIDAMLPEVASTFETPQNYYHHLGVWDHTLEVMHILEGFMESPSSVSNSFAGRIAGHLGREVEGGVDRRSFLSFASLVHDIGKPVTMSVEPSGRIRFQGHQRVGAAMAAGIAGRFGLGYRGRAYISGVVRQHMDLGFLLKAGESTESRMRCVRGLGSRCVDVCLLSLADRLATRGEASTPEALERYERLVGRMLSDYFWDSAQPELAGGGDVVIHSRMEPGPEVARALFDLRVAQRESLVTTRSQALEFITPDFKGRMT